MELVLVALDGLLCLGIGLVGMVKGNLQFIDVGFKFLLDAKCFSLGPGLSLQRSLHGVHSPLVVLASVVELFFLLLNLPVNLLPDLSKLKLGTQDLVLLLLKSSFGFLKGSLELLLLNLQATALFVKLVDGPATISQLVQEILDFISQVLVLPLDNIQLLNNNNNNNNNYHYNNNYYYYYYHNNHYHNNNHYQYNHNFNHYYNNHNNSMWW